jgi:hypothetical protein
VSDENNVIFPTPEVQTRGVDAATENMTILKERWSGQPFHEQPVQGPQDIDPWTRD